MLTQDSSVANIPSQKAVPFVPRTSTLIPTRILRWSSPATVLVLNDIGKAVTLRTRHKS
jgi:hypothetical protein